MLKEMHLDDNAPWKGRFRAPVILWTQLAKGVPTRGLVASNKSGVCQLYAWDVPKGALIQLTDRPEGALFGVISPDGRYVYYRDDRKGDEIGHYIRVPFEGGEPQDITPDMPLYSSFWLTVSHKCNLLGFTVAGSQGFNLYCIDLGLEGELGTPRTIYQSKKLAIGCFLSYGGEIGVIASTEHTGAMHFSLLAFDTNSGEKIGEISDGPESSLEANAFSRYPDDFRLLATTNRTGVKRPLIWNPRTGERVDLTLEELEGEVEPWDWSFDGERILLCQFNHAAQQFYTYNLQSNTLSRLNHPGGTFWGAIFLPDGKIYTEWQDSTHPSQLIELDGETGEQRGTVLIAGEIAPGHSWKTVTFTSSDRERIQGWLGLPDGEGPFPTILDTHGGPEAVMTESFSPESQMWLDHGFAYMTINYRGSTTFGREFQEKIWGNPGYWEVEDMVAARDWLVEEGIAKEDQIMLTGWSYGGYLTLQALGKRPDLWAGGVAGIAGVDWAAEYEDEDSTEWVKGWMVAMLGGTPEEKPEQYAASSPITYVDKVKAPVLIIQGRNDTRSPARPIEIYEEKMKELGKSIEVHWFEGGHMDSFAQVELAVENQERMLRFAYRILGGG